MKSYIQNLLTLLFLLLGASTAFAQAPQKFNYQGIARDAKGNPVAQQQLAIKLSILPTIDATVSEYEETQLVTTNEFGLYTLQIGAGNAVNGEMKSVKWETGNKYIRVAIDPKGGTDYVDAGTTQLLSVPYAIYADKAGIARETADGTGKTRAGTVSTSAAGTGTTNYLPKFVAPNTIANSQLWDNGNTLIIGTPASSSANNRMHIYTNNATQQTYLRMENANTGAQGRFLMANDGANSYATFTKYGNGVAGNYGGNAMYPNANLLAFGNNGSVANDGTGRFLITNGGNIGLAITKSSGTTLKFHADFGSGNVGIGGNAAPTSNVHINNNVSGDTLKITNSNTGHTATDGMEIRMTANKATVINRENSSLSLGTNNLTRMIIDSLGRRMYNRDNLTDYESSSANYTPSMFMNNFHQPYSGQYNYLTLTRAEGENTFMGMVMGDSSKVRTWNWGSSPNDVASVFRTTLNTLSLMNAVGDGFHIDLTSGRMGNILGSIGNAQLNINTEFDTAGHFTSNSNNGIFNGILRSEYLGSNVSDHRGMVGRSVPDPNSFWGIGLEGEGGYFGVNGYSSLGGSGGGNTGVRGLANSDNSSYGMQASAGYNTAIGVGNKYGLYAYASGGANNYGVYANLFSLQPGNVTGGYFKGKQTGVYGEADSASASQTSFIGGFFGYKEAIGVMGKSSMTNSAMFVHSNIGVAGSAINTPNYWNVGTYGEALNATYNYAVMGYAPVAANSYAGFFQGDVSVLGNLSKSGGTFKIDHPQDPENKYLIHSFVESPDMMNVYNGNITTDANGFAIVSLPSYFEAENKDFKYQLTVIGTFAQAIIKEEVTANQFVIQTSQPNVKVSWQVTGVRQDAWANANRVVPELEKSAADKGYYLHPELFGKPATQSVGPKGNLSANVRNLPTPADHARDLAEKELQDQIHQDAEQKAKENWKPQQPQHSNRNGLKLAGQR
ncbi:MAG: hypothetical protein JNJ58_05865 [Chitinophagaceae bacterium]|nr:hypothetical protein [Chitinophagaceae bacterium]